MAKMMPINSGILKRLRQWAGGRCLCAESSGLYGVHGSVNQSSFKLRPSIYHC